MSNDSRHAPQRRQMLLGMRLTIDNSLGLSLGLVYNIGSPSLQKVVGGRKKGGSRREPSYLSSCLKLYKILIYLVWEYNFNIISYIVSHILTYIS
jgi:hypothetical protein